MSQNYQDSHVYEDFIRLARNCQHKQFGADKDLMLSLMNKHDNDPTVNHLKIEPLLSEVKKNMADAVEFALNRSDISTDDKNVLRTFLPRIESNNPP